MDLRAPGLTGEELPGIGDDRDGASAVRIAPPSAGFPTSYLLPEAAFVLGIPDRTLGELIAKDHCTVLQTEDGQSFITLAQLDRLHEFIDIVERGIRAEVNA